MSIPQDELEEVVGETEVQAAATTTLVIERKWVDDFQHQLNAGSICWTRGSEHWKDLRTYSRKYLFPLVNVLFLQWSIFYIHYKFSLNTISRTWRPICPLHSESKDASIRFNLSIFSWSRLIVPYWDMHTHVFLQIVNHLHDGPIGRKNLEYQLDFWVMCVLVCVLFGTLPILPRATQQEVLLGIIPTSLARIHTNSH